MDKAFKIDDLTEEQILKVVKYFDTYKNGHGDTSGESESQIWLWYGRLHGRGELTIDIAEQEKEKIKKRKEESYRWRKEQEINQHLKEYKQETAGDYGKYELMKVNEWEDGRSLVVGIMGNYDLDKGKQKRLHAVEIEERQNPDYFQEIIKRFNLVID